MLEQIINLIKDKAIEQFVNNTDVPNSQAETAAEATGESIFEVLKDQVLKGNISELSELLSGVLGGGSAAATNDATVGSTATGNAGTESTGFMSNPIVKAIITKVTEALGQKTDVSQEKAAEASSSVVPNIIQQVIEKFMSPDKTDADFNVNDFIQSVMKEGAKDTITNIAKNVLGGFFK